MSKDLVSEKEETECNNIIRQYKNGVTKENIKEHNPNQPQIPDYPCRILIIGGSASRKTKSLVSLVSPQLDIDKIYLYTKDLYETKYKVPINKGGSTSLRELNDSETFIEY